MKSATKKPKLGSGKRFKSAVKKIEEKEGLDKESAKKIMAEAGRKKYGKTKMTAMAKKGKAKKK